MISSSFWLLIIIGGIGIVLVAIILMLSLNSNRRPPDQNPTSSLYRDALPGADDNSATGGMILDPRQVYQEKQVPLGYSPPRDLSADSSSNNYVLIAFFFAIVLILGGSFIFLGGEKLKRYYDSENWPQTTATIEERSIEKVAGEEQDRYGARIKYHYSIAGKSYTGQRIRFDYDENSTSSSKSAAQDIIGKYEEIEETQVYYNPDDPSEAVLEREISSFNYILVGLGAFFALIGFGGIVFTFSAIVRQTEKLKNDLG